MPLSVTRTSITSRNSIQFIPKLAREREGGALNNEGEREIEREGGSGHWGSQKNPRD